MSHDAGATCLCQTTHRPQPLEYAEHHIWPQGMGGPDVASNRVWLCPTAHYNVHELLRLFIKNGRPLLFNDIKRAMGDWDVHLNMYHIKIATEGFNRMKDAKT